MHKNSDKGRIMLFMLMSAEHCIMVTDSYL